ncbi:MAG: class I SAM-dependent methyltransferase [Bryobacteraceae bacterium]
MNCDPIARFYRWMEFAAFGKALMRRRLAYLPELRAARQILVLGDGDGRALQALLTAAPLATIDSIDLSARMLELARAMAGDERVRHHRGDARSMAFPCSGYDAIVTHFFLDCLSESETAALTARLRDAAGPNALWVISEFQQDTWWRSMAVRFLYAFFSLTTGLRIRRIPDYRSALRQNGFAPVARQTAWRGLLCSELWRAAPAPVPGKITNDNLPVLQ